MTTQAPPYDPRLLSHTFYDDARNQAGVISHWTPGGYTNGDFPHPPPPPPPPQESWADFLSRQSRSAGSYVSSAASGVQSAFQNFAQGVSSYAPNVSVVECNGPCDPSTHAPPPVFRPGSTLPASSVPIAHGHNHNHDNGNGTSCCGASHNLNGVSFYDLNGQQQQPGYASQPATPLSTPGGYQHNQPSGYFGSLSQPSSVYPQGGSQYGCQSQHHQPQPSYRDQVSAPYSQFTGFSSVQSLQPGERDLRMTNQGFNPWNLDPNGQGYASPQQPQTYSRSYSQLPLGGSYAQTPRSVHFVNSLVNPHGLTHSSTGYRSNGPHYGNGNPYSAGWPSSVRV